MHPTQDLYKDANGTLRFKPNNIVTFLLDTHPTADMNAIATLGFSNADRVQFAQLIGYSLSGFGSLSYVDEVTYQQAKNKLTNDSQSCADKSEDVAALRAELQRVKEKLEEIRSAVLE